MRRRGVLLTIVGPWGRTVIPVIVGNEAVVLGNGLSLRFPEPDVREGAMHEDDRSACPLFDVGQLHAVDTQLARLRWGFRARLQGEATTHRDDDRKPEAREPGHDRLLPLVSVRAPNGRGERRAKRVRSTAGLAADQAESGSSWSTVGG